MYNSIGSECVSITSTSGSHVTEIMSSFMYEFNLIL